MGMKHPRYSRAVLKTRRWQALRHKALRRDRFQCVSCGARGRMEGATSHTSIDRP